MRAILGAALAALMLASAAKAEPGLWEARDADSRILLFGSVHALPPDLDWRTPALDQAIAKSEHVYFETDIGPRGMAAIAVKMVVASFQSATQSWTYLLDDDEYLRLADALAGVGIDIEEAGRMPPWAVAMQLSADQMAGENGTAEFRFESGVEWTLQWELPPERKAYLETPGEQFDLLATGTIEEQVAQLMAGLDEYEAGKDELDRLVTAWLGGEVETLAGLMEPEGEAEQAAIETLLLNRNRNWIPALEKLLAENRENLVIVGAAHLAGDGSVLDLLEQAGYTITRIQ